MKQNNYKDYVIMIIPIIILMIISFFNLKNASLMATKYDNYLLKQIIWYAIGYLIIFLFLLLKPKKIIKYSFYYYLFGLLLLLIVLFLGDEVGGAKAWLNFKLFSVQPSEFMKLALLLYLTKLFSEFKKSSWKKELVFLIKIFLIVGIPSILTFLEPDTGAVIIYIVMTFFFILLSNLKKRWIIYISFVLLLFIITFFYLYYNKDDLFIKWFGTEFFYRMDRIIDFKTSSSLQLQNALIASGSGGIFGHGYNKVALYFPEAPTDFVFALSMSNFGLLGALLILLSFIMLDIYFFWELLKTKNKKTYYYILGFLSIFLYQQFQNILMNIGLLPIVGIPLPFVSYGGSSMLIYFIMLAIAINLLNEQFKFKI